jgi:pyrimidine deaminase RibD-like protein
MESPSDRFFMRRALALARRGIGSVSPNPPVGALVVRDGRVVGRGFHSAVGSPHAEAMALADAGASAVRGTLYVTLEPCTHHGRTPPCVEAIAAAGISRVVMACADPNPAVSGDGAGALKRLGIEVSLGCESQRTGRLLEPWFHRVTTGREFHAAAVGRSLDGRFFEEPGDWQFRLSPAARRVLEKQRLFFAREGRLSFPGGGQMPEIFGAGATRRLIVYVLPLFLGEAGVRLDRPGGAGAVRLELDFVRELGQTVLAEYSLSG